MSENETREMVNPQWHLLISSYAYIDAAFNHPENTQLKELTGWTDRKPVLLNFKEKGTLDTWMCEANEEFYNKRCSDKTEV